MNFEELLDSRNGTTMRKEEMPFGKLYKKMHENKYENVLDLNYKFSDSLYFTEALKKESERNLELLNPHQVHFTPLEDSAGLYGVNVEKGSYRTFSHLMEDHPAIVANKGFLEATVEDLLSVTAYLHERDIYHVCFAPDNVLTRRNDHSVMLLFHGSAYKDAVKPATLWEGYEDYVAPEVMAGEEPTAEADVYSIGKFIKYAYKEATMPPELMYIVKKSTAENPEKRYHSAADMLKAVKNLRKVRTGAMALLAAAAVSLVVCFIFFSVVPEPEEIEYVTPAPKHANPDDDPLASTLTPQMEEALYNYLESNDSLADAEAARQGLKKSEQDAKGEEIFARHFQKDAERILSGVYTSEIMNSSQQSFLTANQKAMQELVRAQVEIAQRAGISDAKAQRIASEIIEKISNRKKAQLGIRSMVNTPAASSSSSSDSKSPAERIKPVGSTTTVPSFETKTKTEAEKRQEHKAKERHQEEFNMLMKH